MAMSLDDALDAIEVHEIDREERNLAMGYPPDTPSEIHGWWGVANDDGFIAYFGREQDAFAYRLLLVNRLINSEAFAP